jgi:hypothetical protein
VVIILSLGLRNFLGLVLLIESRGLKVTAIWHASVVVFITLGVFVSVKLLNLFLQVLLELEGLIG